MASSPEIAVWLAIRSQSSTADDLDGLCRNNRRCGCDDYRSYGQSIVAPRLTSSAECLSLPEGGSKLVGSDQNQRGRLIDLFYVNWSLYVDRIIVKVWCSHHRKFREKSTQLSPSHGRKNIVGKSDFI